MGKGYLAIMNNRRRTQILINALPLLDRVFDIVNNVCDEEQDALDNMPENLQSGSRYEKIEEAISFLEDAMDEIEGAVSNLQEAIK